MNGSSLKTRIADLGLSQAEFASALDVTPRAISMWLSEERPVPGPVQAYLRLLQACPSSVQAFELNRFRKKGNAMKNGMYGIEFQAVDGDGKAALVFKDGLIFGVDEGGASYDGSYVLNEATGMADLDIKVTMPPNVPSVLGIMNPYTWILDLKASLNPTQDRGGVSVQGPAGPLPINVQFAYLRGLPN